MTLSAIYCNQASPRDIQPSHQWMEGELGGGTRGVEDNEIIAICDCASRLLAPMAALICKSGDFATRNSCYWHADLICTLLTSHSGYQQRPTIENQHRRCADHQQLAKLIGRVVLRRGSGSGRWEGQANDNGHPKGHLPAPFPCVLNTMGTLCLSLCVTYLRIILPHSHCIFNTMGTPCLSFSVTYLQIILPAVPYNFAICSFKWGKWKFTCFFNIDHP